ncbi:MAG: 50S ribosomal protein L32e [Candidatus Bathyarchaeia archaeon]
MTSLEEERAEFQRLMRVRRRIKQATPSFHRQESWRYKRVKNRWRKPKGIDSKMRLSRKGRPKLVSIGYGGPKDVRGLHPTGFLEVLVHNTGELKGLDPETQAVRIARTVGIRKKKLISEESAKLGLNVLNPPRQEEDVTEETAQ